MIDSIKNKKFFKVLVVSTMSSGKSTCINSIIGEDILLSKNQACTSKPTYIINDDSCKEFKAYVRYNDDTIRVFHINNIYNMEFFEKDKSIVDVIIKGNIKGIRNINKVVTFIDTPGINFSGDDTHSEQTYKLIEDLEEGLILYLINATQFGVNDDYELLCEVKRKIEKSNNKIKVLFLINKIDEFDIEKESIDEFIQDVKDYLNDNGFKDSNIIPISALAAKLFNKKINMDNLSRKENKDVEHYYKLFKNDSYSLCDYIPVISLNENISISKAIENTGINLIKKYIEDLLIKENIVEVSDCDMENIYSQNFKDTNVLYIEYNPYTVETIFKINGEEIKSQEKYTSIARKKDRRLQDYLEADGKGWDGIIKEFIKVVNSKNIDIEFKGRKIDYDDLEYTVLRYKNNSKFNINLKYIKVGEDEYK